MITRDLRLYDFYKLSEPDAYGQTKLADQPVKAGSVLMAINITSQSIQDNINYQKAQYIGLTSSALLDDTCVIQYGDKKLKVLYVNPKGRMKQVFLSDL